MDSKALALGAMLMISPSLAPAGNIYPSDSTLKEIIINEVRRRPTHEILKAYEILLRNFSDDMFKWDKYHSDDLFRREVADFYERATTPKECLAADYAIRWLEMKREKRDKNHRRNNTALGLCGLVIGLP